MKTALPAIVAITAITASLAAQRGESRRIESKLPLVIQRLADRDEQRAKTAMHALIRGGKPAAQALRKALAESKDARFRQRAERILPLCEVDAPVRNGLKLGLSADRTELRPGDKVTLTATLCNVSDRDIVVFAGMWYAGNAFTNGSKLRRIERAPNSDKTVEHGARWTVGFCGTGAYPLTVRIPALSAKTFKTVATYTHGAEPGSGKPQGVARPARPTLTMGYCSLPLGKDGDDGELVVQLFHESRKTVSKWRPMGVRKETPNWAGKLRSNRLQLRTRR